jgi:hypothetical protein
MGREMKRRTTYDTKSQPIMAIRDATGKLRLAYRNALPVRVWAGRVMRRRNGVTEMLRGR